MPHLQVFFLLFACLKVPLLAFKSIRHRPLSFTKLMMASKAIGILWDVDGTLTDSYQLCFTSTNEVLLKHGKSIINEAEYHEGSKYTTTRRLAWHATGNPDDRVGESLGKEFDDLYVKLVSTETAAFYDGIKDMLLELKFTKPAIRYGALSNACTAYVTAVLEVNNLDGFFSIGLGADSVPAAKPAADGLLLLCQQMQLLPERCVYIGDSPTDGQAAYAAGMSSIGVTWGSHSKEKVNANFEASVHTVVELKAAIQTFIASLTMSSSARSERMAPSPSSS
jgi:phosphoglycolate phosphatase-like HAD superfamily hydrolase